jgi:hypothetical protein
MIIIQEKRLSKIKGDVGKGRVMRRFKKEFP